jgi:dTDP-4-dehydrorhamnose 3,5-epimerase
MKVESLAIADVKLLTPVQHRDGRGFFSETWNEKALAAAGIDVRFVQDNHAMSVAKGTLRGLHFQAPPRAQAKLVRVVRGAVLDVAVDLRAGSETYGRHVRAQLSAENWTQIWVPKGFAHGYLTLEPGTEVLYKVTDHYSPEHDCGILWNDPALGIDWGIAPGDVNISDKDARLPRLADAAYRL